MNLLINFVIALVLDAAGFVMYVYFFSIGYGLSVAGLALTMLIRFRDRVQFITVVMSVLLIIYGLRLALFLLLRELKNTNYKNLLKTESKSNVPVGVKICIWTACSALFIGQTSPLLFRIEAGKGIDVCSAAGLILMVVGIVMEIAADWQKNQAKKKDAHMFVSNGLYRLVRCPNYLGELLLWTGVFLSGLTVYHTAFQWIIAVLGFIGIIYVMFSGARRLELRQDRNYGNNPDYREYVRTTPIILPFVPLYTVKDLKWLKA